MTDKAGGSVYNDKKLVADLSLDKLMLQDVLSRKC